MADKQSRPLSSEIKTRPTIPDVDVSSMKDCVRRPLFDFIRDAPSIFSGSLPQLSAHVLTGKVTQVQSCLSEKLDINVSEKGNPHCLLHCALLSNVENEVKHRNLSELVSVGAAREQHDACDRTPLHLAVLLGDVSAVDILLKKGCDSSSKCHGYNLLHLATMSGDCAMFEKVRALGYSPAVATDYACTAMHIAAVYNHSAMITHLVGLGVDLNSHCVHSDAAIIQPFSPIGYNAMISYTLQGLIGVSRGLVKAKVGYLFDERMVDNENDVEQVSKNAYPLAMGVQLCCVDAVKCLVNHGADVSTYAGALFDMAIFVGSQDLVAYFFNRSGRDQVVMPTDKSRTLITAVVIGAVDIVSFLVENCNKYLVSSVESTSLLIPDLSLADMACIVNQPAVLSAALKWEKNGTIYSSRAEPALRILLSIFGGWLLHLLCCIVPHFKSVFNASREDRMKVISILSSLPQCNLLELPSTLNLTNSSKSVTLLDIAASLCQPAACDAIVREMKKCNIGPDLSRPLIPACLFIAPAILDLMIDEISTTLPAHLTPSDLKQSEEIKETVGVLCRHGYDINAVIDYNHRSVTCFDITIESNQLEFIQFLRDNGAVTFQQLVVQEKAIRFESRVHQVERERSKLKRDKDELAKENEQLHSHNSQLMSVLSQAMQFVQPLSSVLTFGGLPSGFNTSVQNPGTRSSIRLADGEELTASDVRLFAPRWRDVCVRLGLQQPLLEVIEANHSKDCEAACRDMLTRWIIRDSDTGMEPRTLDTLCRVLKQCGCSEYAKTLKERHSKYTHPAT